jgi:hypothetical protein
LGLCGVWGVTLTKWNFINVYGAAHEEDKDEFLAELVSFIRDCKEPVIIGGRF